MTSPATHRVPRGFALSFEPASLAGRAGLELVSRGGEATIRGPGLRGYASSNVLEAPDVHVDGARVCLFHGWLASPRQLAMGLGEPSLAGRPAALILAVFRARGLEGFSRLRGQFAAAIVDVADRELIALRDPFGVKSLYWSERGGTIHVASSLELLLPLLPRAELSPSALAEHISTGGFTLDPRSTHFVDVVQVPAGHYRRASGAAPASEARYWAPRETAELRYAHAGDYEEHFRETLFRSIDASLGDERTAICELSGGLDSSTVTVVADRLLRSRAGSVRVASYAYKDRTDEQDYQRAVVERCGLDHHVLVVPSDLSLDDLRGAVRVGQFSVQRMGHELERRLDGLGASVCLTGHGGDIVLGATHSRQFLADLKATRRWRQLGQALVSYARVASARALLRDVLGGARPANPARPPWLDLAATSRPPTWRAFDQPARQGILDDVLQLVGQTYEDPYRRLEYRHSLLVEELLMFMLRIPWEHLVRAGEDRALQRRSLAGILPDAVRLRTTKTDFTPMVIGTYRGLVERYPALLEAPRLRALGVVRGDAFETTVNRGLHGLIQDDTAIALSAVLVEAWLAANDGPPRRERTAMGAAYVEVFA
jgi:asparagine synthase (glutamine-hydrolysing)